MNTGATRCPDLPARDGEAGLGLGAFVGPLSLIDGAPTTYEGPDVTKEGFVLRDLTGEDRSLDVGVFQLFLTNDNDEVVSAPLGVEAIGVLIDLPAAQESVAPFVWNRIDCRTQLSVEPGTYRGVLFVESFGAISVEQVRVTPETRPNPHIARLRTKTRSDRGGSVRLAIALTSQGWRRCTTDRSENSVANDVSTRSGSGTQEQSRPSGIGATQKVARFRAGRPAQACRT